MKKLFFALVLFSTFIFAQAPSRVSTLAGDTSPAIYMQNHYYNNGKPATFSFPKAVTVTPDGNTYVMDEYVPVIRKITPDGFTSEYAGNSTFVSPSYTGYGNVDGNLSTARFNNPQGLTSDSSGSIYVADTYNHSLRKITGNTVSTISSDFVSPNSLCVDASGNMYVADGNRIRKVTPAGVVTTITGSTTGGNTTGALLTARFRNITNIAVDGTGTILYASDTDNGQLKKINLIAGTVSTVSVVALESGNTYMLMRPTGLAFYNGNLFVADRDGNLIFKINASGVASRYAGNGIGKWKDGLSTPDRLGAALYGPEQIAVDTSGNLYVADRNNQRIRKVTP